MSELKFTVYGRPEPQGSTRAFIPKGWKRPIITSDNQDVRAWKDRVSKAALAGMEESGAWAKAYAGIAVGIECLFYLAKPPSVSKKRRFPVVKPDFDKLTRAAADALSSIAYEDDAQICDAIVRKRYGSPERTEIRVWILGANDLPQDPDEAEPANEQQVLHLTAP